MMRPHSLHEPRYLGMCESRLKGVSKSGFGMRGTPQEGHGVPLIEDKSSFNGSVNVSSVSSRSFIVSSFGMVFMAMRRP